MPYDEHKDLAYYQICVTACKERKIYAPYSELAFIKTGFKNWKKTLEKLKSHCTSACHRDVTQVVITLPNETTTLLWLVRLENLYMLTAMIYFLL